MSEPRAPSEHDVTAAPHDAYAALLTQELRLPVAAILGLLQPLEEPIWGGDAAVLQQYVALLGARAQHVAKVADELTTFSALILGQPAADRHGAVVPLAALVRELAGERPGRVTIARAADEPAVDTERLRLVLQVLLESAFTLNAPGTEVQVR